MPTERSDFNFFFIIITEWKSLVLTATGSPNKSGMYESEASNVNEKNVILHKNIAFQAIFCYLQNKNMFFEAIVVRFTE